MKIDRNYVEQFKNQIANEDECVYFEITEKGSAEQRLALAELGECLEELSYDECEEVRFAVLRTIDGILKEKRILLFHTFEDGEAVYFVIPSKEEQITEKMKQDESERVRNFATSVLCWQQARAHYKRFGGSSDVSKDLYIRRAHKKLINKNMQPIPTCFELGYLSELKRG